MKQLMAVAAILLAGCVADPPLPHMALQSKSCAALAQGRMADAAANGYDQATQAAVFKGSYSDCVKWEDKAVGQ